MAETVRRKLAAIVAADIVSFSRLMADDEQATLHDIERLEREVLDPSVAQHEGRVFKTMGDGFLIEFPSSVEAVRCATHIQARVPTFNLDQSESRMVRLRIGVHVGDVMVRGDDLYGDGVNIAARLEPLAEAGGICISGPVRDQLRSKLSLVFEDGGEPPLKNISEPIRVYHIRLNATPEAGKSLAGGAVKPALAYPDRPSIAVLPFDNMSGDGDQEYFSDGMVEELLTRLAKVDRLFVIARHSSFALRGHAMTPQEIGRELGVRFLVEGSVRRRGERVRIATQLIDAADGHYLWADRYDTSMDDIFRVQDEITRAVVTELDVMLAGGDQVRNWHSIHDPRAWELMMKALWFSRKVTRAGLQQAASLCRQALAIEPTSAYLNGICAIIELECIRQGWIPSLPDAIARAQELARKALALDSDEPTGHLARALLLTLASRHDEAQSQFQSAIRLNPNYADSHALYGALLNYSGRPGEGLVEVRIALRLCPFFPPWYLGILGHAYRLLGRYEDAINAYEERQRIESGSSLVDMAIVLSQLERHTEAKEVSRRILDSDPEFTIGDWAKTQFYSDRSMLSADKAALRRAGLT